LALATRPGEAPELIVEESDHELSRREELPMSANGHTAAGVTVPDTKLAREATELVRSSTSDLVYHHSSRVFWFGSLQGRNRGFSFDPELLYIGAMFHDLGLNEEFRRSGRRCCLAWEP
jgi:hypothetical protein